MFDPEVGSSKFLQNVSELQMDYTVLNLRRYYSSLSRQIHAAVI
jgi:hypothetical protein